MQSGVYSYSTITQAKNLVLKIATDALLPDKTVEEARVGFGVRSGAAVCRFGMQYCILSLPNLTNFISIRSIVTLSLTINLTHWHGLTGAHPSGSGSHSPVLQLSPAPEAHCAH